MLEQPLVTIYITNYNYGKYLRKSIESALGQSLDDIELIIIDDGSTDDSKEIIEEYRSNPIVSIIYQHNKGLNISNNIAMRASSGKYIMRLDADDFLEREAVKKMSSILESDPELGLVFPDYYYVDETGQRTGHEQRHDFDKEVSLYDQPAHGACTMIRLDFLKKLGGYNESFTCQDGYDLWIKFVTHHKVTNINEPLFSYRHHNSNLTKNEERILSTRKQIKEVFVNQYHKTPTTIAVIPVRSLYIGDVNWPLYLVNGKSILELKVEECLKTSKLSKIVISSSDVEILEHCKSRFNNISKVDVLERPQEFAKLNETLSKTIEQALIKVETDGLEVEAIMSVSLEYPFLGHEVIDELINTLTIFNSDSVLSVRLDDRMYYQHNGHTLKPILDRDKFTRLEREALYSSVGGVVISSKKNFVDSNTLVSGRISHIIVDTRTAFSVAEKFSLKLFESLKN